MGYVLEILTAVTKDIHLVVFLRSFTWKSLLFPFIQRSVQVYNFDGGLGIEEGTWVTDRWPHLLGHCVESQEPGCTALRLGHLSISGGRFPCSPLCRLFWFWVTCVLRGCTCLGHTDKLPTYGVYYGRVSLFISECKSFLLLCYTLPPLKTSPADPALYCDAADPCNC